jgi:hypothetical protein
MTSGRFLPAASVCLFSQNSGKARKLALTVMFGYSSLNAAIASL